MRRAAAPMLAALCLAACVSSTRTTPRSIEMEQPRVSAGWVAGEGEQAELQRAVAELEAAEQVRQRRRAQAAAAKAEPLPDIAPLAPPARTEQTRPARRAFSPPTPLADAMRLGRYPADAGQIVPLDRLSATELEEIVDALALRLQTEHGYARAGDVIAEFLPPLPEGVVRGDILARSTDDGLRLIRLGYRRYISQTSQLWVYGVVVRPDEVVANPDMAAVEPAAAEALESVRYMRADLTAADLEAQLVQLSFVDASTALTALSGLGVRTAAGAGEMPPTFSLSDLPIVAAMPAPSAESTALVGGEAEIVRDASGMFAIPTVARRLTNETVAGPTSQLLVLFHPAHPEQHSRVIELLDTLVDVPARQVFIEGMIVEISEEGLEELGVEWQFQDGPFRATVGTTDPGLATETADLRFNDSLSLPGAWSVRIKALVRENKAEVLARPSVLTLDNRQATIRIGTDIPVATSQEGLGGGASKISFDFRYIPTGILLNVRPRIDAENDQISMQIDTTVSATVPGADLEVRNDEGTLLASAPTISSRRVQTYARIGNNTPLIIGGLVARQETLVQDKVPLLGDLPLLGALFRAERRETSRNEVIIVLTPYVLPERERLDRTMPKTEDVFDSAGYDLFRDAHRLREEEVFDLKFLTESPRLAAYRRLANAVIGQDFRLAGVPPFSLFAGERIPGENILVHRMIYEVVKNLEYAERLRDDRIIFLVDDDFSGYRVHFLQALMAEFGDGVTMESFFAANPGAALTVVYYRSGHDRPAQGDEPAPLGLSSSDPTPEVGMAPCANRRQWGELLWRLNQPDEQGRRRSAIVLQSPDDLVRLRRAIALKRIVELNGGEPNLTLRSFSVGAMLQMPDLQPDAVQVIDADVARYFFHTEHYYQAATQTIERAVESLDAALRRPDINPLLEGVDLPADDPGAN